LVNRYQVLGSKGEGEEEAEVEDIAGVPVRRSVGLRCEKRRGKDRGWRRREEGRRGVFVSPAAEPMTLTCCPLHI
jgi:hypothetical protein